MLERPSIRSTEKSGARIVSTSARRRLSTLITNKKLGNDFETEFCEILRAHGFWAHNFAQKKEGQPADVIASRDGRPALIDCKVCSTKRGFRLDRREENQLLAMELWSKTGNGFGWFALKFDDEIIMVGAPVLNRLSNVQSYITLKDIKENYHIELEGWISLWK